MSESSPPHIKNLSTTCVSRNFYTEPMIDAQNTSNGNNEESTADTSVAGLPMMAHTIPPYCANTVSNFATGEQFFSHAMLSDFLAMCAMTTPHLTDSQFPIMYNDFRSLYGPSLVTAPPQQNYVFPNLLTVRPPSDNVFDHSARRNSIEAKMQQLRQGFGGLAHDSFEPQNYSGNSSTIDRMIPFSECSMEESAEDCTTSSHQLLSQQFAYGDSTDGGSTDGASTEMVLVASSSLECEKMSYTENTTLVCSACPHLNFLSTTLFYQHYVTEHVNEKKIQCEKCPRKFRSPVKFRDHLRDFHSDCNVFKCPECTAEFPRQQDFTLHYRRIHLELPPIQCKICREEFTNHTALHIHMVNVHSIEEP